MGKRVEETMSRGITNPAKAGTPAFSEPRRLGGSIDYDLYRALARELREEFIAQVASSLGHHLTRLLDLLPASLAAMGCRRAFRLQR
jgi:hypothetical protein